MSDDVLNGTTIGPRVPRRGNAFSRGFGRLGLRLLGWRVVGSPPDEPRFILTAVPHTSNWDGLIFLLAILACGLDFHWVGKDSLFTGPGGRWLRWMGGIAVDRRQARDFASGVAARIREAEQLVIVIAPEGTRKATTRWKSGFHRIARAAGVPTVIGYMDYGRRQVGFGPTLAPDASLQEQLAQMRSFLADVRPRHPERFRLPEDAV